MLTRLRDGSVIIEVSEFNEADRPEDSELVVARKIIDPDVFRALIAWGQGKA